MYLVVFDDFFGGFVRVRRDEKFSGSIYVCMGGMSVESVICSWMNDGTEMISVFGKYEMSVYNSCNQLKECCIIVL